MIKHHWSAATCHGLTVAVSLTMALTPVLAADAKNGEELARRWCAPCHVVASNQRTPTSEAPPFATISRAPGFDAAKVALFLLHPHPKMPDMGLSRVERSRCAGDQQLIQVKSRAHQAAYELHAAPQMGHGP